MQHSRWPVLAVAVMSLGLWALYLKTLSPAFPPDDSPETVAAAATLGIQHPPGYPLATLAGRVAVLGMGLGAPAWRVNMLSAGLAVLVALLAGALAAKLAGGGSTRWAARALAMGCLGIWRPFWLQATEAKGGIYLLTLALGLAALHAAFIARERTEACWSAATGLACGLALAAHFLMAAPLLAAALALCLGTNDRMARAKRFGLWLLPGLSLYLYLPLRAKLWPMVDLGHPVDWGQLRWMLTRSGYTQAGLGSHWVIAAEQTKLWWSAWMDQGLAWAPLLGLAGGWGLRRAAAKPAWILGAALAWAFVAGAWINKTAVETRFLAQIFLLPADLLILVFAGAGLSRFWEARGWKAGAALGLSLAAVSLGASRGYAQADRSQGFLAYDYAHDLALCLPRGTLYFGEGDFNVLPLFHLQAVEGRRRDLGVVVADLAGQRWHQAALLRARPDAPAPVAGEDTAAALAWLASAPAPVAASSYGARLDAAGLARAGSAARQWGLARLIKGAASAPPAFEKAWAARHRAKPLEEREPLERQILPWYAVAQVQAGNEAGGRGDNGRAAALYRGALGLSGDLPYGPISFNLGLALEQAGEPMAASAAYARALEIEPTFGPARERLAALSSKRR